MYYVVMVRELSLVQMNFMALIWGSKEWAEEIEKDREIISDWEFEKGVSYSTERAVEMTELWASYLL